MIVFVERRTGMQLKTLLESLEQSPEYSSDSDRSLETIGQLDITNLAYDSRNVEPDRRPAGKFEIN